MVQSILIQKQHKIFQQFKAVMDEYEAKKAWVKENFSAERGAAEIIWANEQAAANAALEQIHQIMRSTQGTIDGSPWRWHAGGRTS